MARQMTFDFTDAPPAQGGQSSDHVAPGKHTLRLTDWQEQTARTSGNKMQVVKLEVVSGADQGKTLIDRFVTGSENKFGLQRLHAFLLALQLPVKQKQVKLDVDRLIGRLTIGQIVDEVVPANDQYPERLQSKIVAYYAIEGAAPAPEAVADAPVAAPVPAAEAPAPAPAPAPTQPAPEPVAVAAAAATAAAPAPVAAAPDVSDVDDLFA